MFPVVAHKVQKYLMPQNKLWFTRYAEQPEIIRECNRSVVEKHVVVGTQAKNVGFNIRPVVGRSERFDVCAFRIWAGRRF